MALQYIGHENNFVYINDETLHDVQSVSAQLSLNSSIVQAAGYGGMANIHQGELNGSLSLERLSINDDPFTGLFTTPFSGAWRYIDSQDVNRYFSLYSGYISQYSFSAETQSIPTISTEILAYGNMIGGTSVPTGNITTDLDGFVDNYVAPKGMNLTFSEGTTNRVQSFNLSVGVSRTVRQRLGELKSIPQNFVSYPINVGLSIGIEVDAYSSPKIDSLLCKDTEDISLELTNCEGSVIRTFTVESGKLESVSMEAGVGNNNTAQFEFNKQINNVNLIQDLFQ